MKKILLLVLLFFSTYLVYSQCGPVTVTPDPITVMNCGGVPDTINFTVTGTCSGNYEYQILNGATVIQPWSTIPYAIVSSTATTTYTVEVRCDACPATVISDTFFIEVILPPIITGSDTVCSGYSTTLTASGSTGDFEWWTDQTGGTQLDTGTTYTTPNLTTTTSYWIQANGQTQTTGKILITECGLEGASGGTGSEDYIEISNLYSVPVNTTGWVVAISDSYSNINSVNSDLWYLPSSFTPCSVVYRTDDSSDPNYWGSNIYWNPGTGYGSYASWAIVIDDQGNVMDFCCWGWTAADIAAFNPTINGFNITLGPEWTGDGVSNNCTTTGGLPYSIQRIGNADSNTLNDFVCQASTQNVVNPGLSCGWSPVSCRFEVPVIVLPGLDIDSTFTNPTCVNGTDGSINLILNTGIAPYDFVWSNGDSTQTITGLNAGVYDATVTDDLGCTGTISVTLVDPPAITATGSSTDEVCNQADGTITISGSGGTGSLSYDLGNGPNTSGYFTGLTAGPYTITITDAVGCSVTEIITVNATGNVTSGFTASPDQCLNGNSFNFTNTGDTGAGITWSWSFPGGTPSTSTDENPTGVTWNTPGQYIITQTAMFGSCNHTTVDTINVFEHPVVNVTVVDVTCNGICDGTATANVTGGTVPYTYLWNDPSAQTTQTAIDLCAGNINLIVLDGNGCDATGGGTVTENTAMVLISQASTDVTCYGYSDATISVEATGGCPPLTYEIPGQTTTSGDFINLGGGNYEVTVTDCNGCTIVSSPLIVNEPSQLVIDSYLATDATCYNADDGIFTIVATGGAGGLQYSIDGINFQPGGAFTGLAPGNYTCVIYDVNGCSITQGFSIIEPQEIIISSSGDQTVCDGEYATLNVSVVGGTAPYTYIWDHIGPTLNSAISVSPIQHTTYTVYVQDVNDCISNESKTTIYVAPPVQLTVTSNVSEVCPGDEVLISVSPTSGIAPYQVYLNDNLGNAPFDVYPMTTTTYTLFVEDLCGTTASQDLTITVNPLPSVMFQPDTTSGCQPLPVNFTSLFNADSYIWNFGENDFNNLSHDESPLHIYENPGVYTVTLEVISDHGCKNSITYADLIHVWELPDAKFVADPEVVSVIKPIIYFTNVSTLTDTSYWFFGDGDSSNTFNPYHTYPIYPTGNYNVQLVVSSDKGCRDTVYSTVSVKNEYTFYAPSAFSPDHDGINDEFKVFGNGIDERAFQMYIYNRWGEVVFETNEMTDYWDGRVKGSNEVKLGAYTWLVIYKDLQGIEHEETGAVTIIR